MKLALRLNKYDKLTELLIWLVIAGHFLYICLHYQSLPNEIPTHFDMKGNADAFGSKSNIWLLALYISPARCGYDHPQ